MKKQLILLSIIFVTFLSMSQILSAGIVTQSFSMSNGCYTCHVEEGNNLVYIDCDDDACWLTCIGGGNTKCCWSCVQGCMGCIESLQLFEEAGGNDMYDYMHNQISLDNFTGNYTNNIMYIPTYTYYYRTINWSYDQQSDELTATLYISYED